MKTEAQILERAARLRARYAADPVYRARVLALGKAYNAKHPETGRRNGHARRNGPKREEILAKKREEGRVRDRAARRAYDTDPANVARKSAYDRQRRAREGPKLSAQQLAWRQANKAKLNAYCRTRRATEPQYAIANNMRCRINSALRAAGLRRKLPLTGLLGCTIPELMVHLERQFTRGMTWANRGHRGRVWHIDHIKPCDAFDLTDPRQRTECFHFTNLQPLWARDNMRKTNRTGTSAVQGYLDY